MIREFNPSELERFLPQEVERLMPFCEHSTPLLAWFAEDSVIALFGLIPSEGHAYIWTYTDLNLVKPRRISYARKAQRLIRNALSIYTSVIGHCESHQRRWLLSLGARFFEGPPGYLIFQIEDL